MSFKIGQSWIDKFRNELISNSYDSPEYVTVDSAVTIFESVVNELVAELYKELLK